MKITLQHFRVSVIVYSCNDANVMGKIMKKQILETLESGEKFTAIGICSALGFRGYNRDIYNALDELAACGEIKSSGGFCDTEYWV